MKKGKRKKRNRGQTQTQTQITNRDQAQTKPISQPKPKSSANPTTNPCSQHPHASLQIFPFPIVFTTLSPHGLHDQNLQDQPLDLLATSQYRVR